VQVPGLANITALAAGDYHVLALSTDKTIWSWGFGEYGQLGDGLPPARLTPVLALFP
jgi:alpha-tubulin suppressor-like RCC1 family protein